jgi:hypothetical protein
VFKAIGADGRAGADELVKTSIDGGINVELTFIQEELRQLDEVSALPTECPGRVLTFQGSDRL